MSGSKRMSPEFFRHISYIINGYIPKNKEEKDIKKYIKLVLTMAEKYVRPGVEYEDLVMCGIIGLIEASRHFDPTRSSNFDIHAITRIKGRLYEYCIKNTTSISVPIYISKTRVYIDRMTRLLEQEHTLFCRHIEPREIIGVWQHEAELLLSIGSLDKLRCIKAMVDKLAKNSKTTYETIVSLAYESITIEVPDDESAMSHHITSEDSIINNVAANELVEKLRENMGKKKASILVLHQQGLNNEDIADVVFSEGITPRRVSRQAIWGLLKSAEKKVKDDK